MLTAMFFARDVDRMASFYGDGFGLAVDPDESQPGYRCLTGDGIRIALHEIAGHVDVTIDDPPEPRTQVPVKLLLGVSDVTAVRARLEALGGQVFETATDDAFDVADPEGNVIRIHRRGG